MNKKKTISFICSEHGEQEFNFLYICGIQLACGCSWRSMQDDGLVEDEGVPASCQECPDERPCEGCPNNPEV